MINNILLTILLFLVIVYINRESINKRLAENFNPNTDGGNTSFDVGDTVYFKTDIVPLPEDMNLCATDEKTSKNLIVEGQICSVNGDKALLKYTSIINPNINDKCKDKYSYDDIRSVPVISRTADGLNNTISQGEQTKYLGGIKMDGSPQCGVEGSVYKRKSRWDACKNSDECGPGLHCRVGDNRCMDDADCEKTNWDNKTNNSCERIPKTITENSFPVEIPLTKLSRNMPFNLRGNEEKRRASSDNLLLNAYYTYDDVANNVESVNEELEQGLNKNIADHANNLTSNFGNRSTMALELSNMTKQLGDEIVPKANNQLSRQQADTNFKKQAIDAIVNESSRNIESIISQNTQNVANELPSILDRQFKTQMQQGVGRLSDSRNNVKLIEDTYTQLMGFAKKELENNSIVPINAGLQKSAKDALAYKKLKLPREDLSNYRGVLVRTYNSDSGPQADGSQRGTLLDEKIVPSINYFMTTTFDSFFTASKTSRFRYLEFFGHINFPNTAEAVEFNIVAGSGIRFYFGGELQIDEYSNSSKVDHYSRLNYVQPNSTIPYKIIAFEGDNNTNSHLILKWRINRKGNFNVVPAANYFLPNLKYD
jgi:hypothetical protein